MRGLNLLVFCGNQRRVCGHTLKAALAEQLRLLCRESSRERLIGALLRAGELECGLADVDSEGAHSAELLTERLADALLCVERWGGSESSDFQLSNFLSADIQNFSFQNLLTLAQDLPVADE